MGLGKGLGKMGEMLQTRNPWGMSIHIPALIILQIIFIVLFGLFTRYVTTHLSIVSLKPIIIWRKKRIIWLEMCTQGADSTCHETDEQIGQQIQDFFSASSPVVVADILSFYIDVWIFQYLFPFQINFHLIFHSSTRTLSLINSEQTCRCGRYLNLSQKSHKFSTSIFIFIQSFNALLTYQPGSFLYSILSKLIAVVDI